MTVTGNSKELENFFLWKDYLLMYVDGPLVCIGIITSVLSLLLFKRDNKTAQGTRFLFSMVAVADTLFLTCSFVFWIMRDYLRNDIDVQEFFQQPSVYGLLFYVCNVFEFIRNWLVVMIAIERYLFLLKPVEFKVMWGARRVRRIVIVLYGIAVCTRLPVLVYGIAKYSSTMNTRVERISRLIHNITDCIFLTSIPVTLMIVTSAITSLKYKSILRVRRQLQNGSSTRAKSDFTQVSLRTRKIIRTVLWTFVIFSLPSIPASIVHCIVLFNNYENQSIILVSEILSAISNYGSVMTSTSNFFVYIFVSSRYRKILLEILCLDHCCHERLTVVNSSVYEQDSRSNHNR